MQNIQSFLQGRYLVAIPSLVQAMEDQFSLVSDEPDNWRQTYLDTVTGTAWRGHLLDGSGHGGGTRIFINLPLPDTDKLIHIALTSGYEDEVYAAGRMLLEIKEMNGIDFRLQ